MYLRIDARGYALSWYKVIQPIDLFRRCSLTLPRNDITQRTYAPGLHGHFARKSTSAVYARMGSGCSRRSSAEPGTHETVSQGPMAGAYCAATRVVIQAYGGIGTPRKVPWSELQLARQKAAGPFA